MKNTENSKLDFNDNLYSVKTLCANNCVIEKVFTFSGVGLVNTLLKSDTTDAITYCIFISGFQGYQKNKKK